MVEYPCRREFIMQKTALVTGSSRGIGAAIARALAASGWQVILHYNKSEAAAMALAEELNTRAIPADVTDPAQVAELFRRAGDVDLLVCCAGVAEYTLFPDADETHWAHIRGVNLDGVHRCCRAAIPAMIRNHAGGLILVSSVWGVYGAAMEASYSATKAALVGLTKALAKELGPSGIRVNCIAPGVIDTDMLAQFDAADRRALAEETPLGRIGRPEDVAALAAFLASDNASFITGQIIGCDGGFGM